MSEEEQSAADRLDLAISAIEAPVVQLTDYSRRTRALVWALSASVVVDMTLTALVVMFAVQAHGAARAAQQADEATRKFTSLVAYRSCDGRNQFRTLDLKRWLFILDLYSAQAPPRETPEAKAFRLGQADRLRSYITEADAAENCATYVSSAQSAAPRPKE